MSNQKKIYKRSCLNCGKEFETDKKGNKFCSSECKDKYYNVEVECTYCGKKFTVTRTKYLAYLRGSFKNLYCSNKCVGFAKKNKSTTKRCLNCHDNFTSKHREQKFCSKECKDNYRNKKSEIKRINICPKCGKLYISKNKKSVFCSRTCANEDKQKRITVKCCVCGKEFEKLECRIGNEDSVHYCSSYCMNHKKWSEEDTEILRTYYYLVPMDELIKMLNNKFTKEQIIGKAQNTKGITKSRLWSEKDIELLKKHYPSSSYDELCKMFPNRTLCSITHKARQYGLIRNYTLERLYSDEDNEYIKENYLKIKTEEIAKHLNRTPDSIVDHARDLGLSRPRAKRTHGYHYINKRMRSLMMTWRYNYLKKANNTCELTGKQGNVVLHHIKSFNLILDEAFLLSGIEVKNKPNDYTDDEIHDLFEVFYDVHEKYSEYICIDETIHKEFHNEYGYGDNTREQWDEFLRKKGY